MANAAAAAADPNLQLTLRVLCAIGAILVVSAICGRLALKVGQPRVLGEMVAGVLLGPTAFGAVLPAAQRAMFPPEVQPVLYVLSTIGLTLYMFLVGAGFERHHESARISHALTLAVFGVVPSLLLGAGAGYLLHTQLSRPDVDGLLFALFLGGALSITAFPMLARILYERRLQSTRLGRISLLAASFDDAAAWCLLAVVSALHAGAGPAHVLRMLAGSAGFVVFMLAVVARLLRPLGKRVERTGHLGLDEMYVVIGVALLAGLFTDYIGIYSVFGGFIAGLAMPRNEAFRIALHTRMMEAVCVLLLPIFFAFSGLNTRLGALTRWPMIAAFALILAAGFLGKYGGCAVAMRLVGRPWHEAWAVGGLMNARGLMILIFINIGLAQQIITPDVFTMLVMVAVVTTTVAIPLYRLAMQHAERSPNHIPHNKTLAGKDFG